MTRTKIERYRPTFISRSHPDKGFEVSTGDKNQQLPPPALRLARPHFQNVYIKSHDFTTKK
jgi:hypothetical protein